MYHAQPKKIICCCFCTYHHHMERKTKDAAKSNLWTFDFVITTCCVVLSNNCIHNQTQCILAAIVYIESDHAPTFAQCIQTEDEHVNITIWMDQVKTFNLEMDDIIPPSWHNTVLIYNILIELINYKLQETLISIYYICCILFMILWFSA